MKAEFQSRVADFAMNSIVADILPRMIIGGKVPSLASHYSVTLRAPIKRPVITSVLASIARLLAY